MTYRGGPVMTSNTNYPLYWAPAGESAYPAGYISGIDRWFSDLAHDSGGLLNTDSVLTQYGDKEGGFANYNSHFGGALIDTDPYPANGCKAAADLPHRRTAAEPRSRPTPKSTRCRPTSPTSTSCSRPRGSSSCFEASGHRMLGRGRETLQVLRLPQLLPGGRGDLHLRRQPVRRNAPHAWPKAPTKVPPTTPSRVAWRTSTASR